MKFPYMHGMSIFEATLSGFSNIPENTNQPNEFKLNLFKEN